MKRVLFLDIDGVLNSRRTHHALGQYPMELEHLAGMSDPVALRMLQRLCDSAGVSVVLSSAWRKIYAFEDVGKALGLPIIDATCDWCRKGLTQRGEEIQEWLDRHPDVEHWAIVDDGNDMLPSQQSRFVRTSEREGLTFGAFLRICSLLQASPGEGEPRVRNWMEAGAT